MADSPGLTGRLLAGVGRRTIAYVLDLALVGGAVLGATDDDRPPLERALRFARRAVIAGTVCHVLLEGLAGRTVGKVAVGIAVVGEDGTSCTFGAATVRTLGRFVDGLPVASLVGLVSIALTNRRQRIGDLLAGTMVVRTRGDGSRPRGEASPDAMSERRDEV